MPRFAKAFLTSGKSVGFMADTAVTVPNYDDPRATSMLVPGLVITVEPIFSRGDGEAVLAPDGWTVRTADRSDAAHFEHTLVVTESEPILLTAAA